MTDKDSKARNILAFAIGLAIIILALGLTIYLNFTKPATDVTKKVVEAPGKWIKYIGDAVSGAFKARVTINGNTHFHGKEGIRELALSSENVQHRYEYESTWLGSKKKIEILYTFEIKAGFDLEDGIKMDINDRKKTVTVVLPEAEILSCELKKREIKKEDQGYWNKIKAEERNRADAFVLSRVRRMAQKREHKEDAKAVVEREMKKLIGDILQKNDKDYQVIIEYQSDKD